MNLQDFGELVRRYQHQQRAVGHHDARRQAFFSFAQRAFDIDLDAWAVEEKVYRGWVDAILGNLVFEFKSDLNRELEEGKRELERYLRDLHARYPATTYTAVLTDGLTFHIYRPEYVDDVVELQPLPGPSMSSLDVSRTDALADCYHQLDALLAGFRADAIPPTTQHIVASLGSESTSFRAALADLSGLYHQAAEDPAVAVRFRQWNRYLGIVLGQGPEDVDLFLRHTFLATVNKLIAYLTLEPDHPPETEAELLGIISGEAFTELGIQNFIEEDFFTWFLSDIVRGGGLSLLRRLAGTLRRYDYRRVSQDVLKELYQEIVGRDARHDIGEYYTPDWLAELILREAVDLRERPETSILDPACGSGTFLFIAVRLIRGILQERGWSTETILDHVLENVQGVDIHPVAVITSRTNYLIALGDLLEGERPSIAVPIYLADSVLPPERQSAETVVATRRGRRRAQAVGRLEGEQVLPWSPGEGSATFEYPASVLEHPQMLDALIDAMGYQLRFLSPGCDRGEIEAAAGRYRTAVREQALRASLPLSSEAESHLADMFRQVGILFSEGKDTVWLFLLKNVPRPVFLQQRKFDAVVGNPPWLSLRYFRGAGYARRIKRLALEDYGLRPHAQTHLATQMELATLFFARAVDLYLRHEGTIAFVMPRSIMVASQHARFNEFSFKGGSLPVKLSKLIDLEDVTPLFNVPACVLVGTKGQRTSWPVPATRIAARLDDRNLTFDQATSRLRREPQELERIEGRLLPSQQAAALRESLGRSPYADRFTQGATLVPRVFWFVRRRERRVGSAAEAPPLETDEDAVRQAKEPWRDIRMQGSVEAQFVYATMLSGDVVPFGYTRLCTVVLPILPEGRGYRLLDVSDALSLGFPLLAARLRDVQSLWEARATRDAEELLKIPRCVHRLDYRRLLRRQRPDTRYKVIYGRSGTNLASTVVDTANVERSLNELVPSGFIVDSTNHYAETDDEGEAHYLVSVLNSEVLDQLIKPLQTRGLWGERDIYQLAWRIPIPQYDQDSALHRQLGELAQACEGRVAAEARELAHTYRSPARRRSAVRDLLQDELADVDALVRRLLGND